MKTATTALLALLTASTAFAERSALISYDDQWNLFSKFELGITDIDESSAMMGGAAVGGLLNDHVGIGIAGRTVLDSVETQSPRLQDISDTDFWYGGGYLEYVFSPDSLVYASLNVLVGGGRLEVKTTSDDEDKVSVFAVEPGLNLMVNVTETFNIGLGVTYRFISGVDIEGLDDGAMSGVSGNIFLRFTQF